MIARKAIPLRTLLHGKEIREAAKALEDFRLKFKEEEFLYGATIKVQWGSYGDAEAVVSRPETDNKYSNRLEQARIAAEKKAERERRRQEQEAIKAAQREARKKEDAAEMIKKLAKEAGILVDILDQ